MLTRFANGVKLTHVYASFYWHERTRVLPAADGVLSGIVALSVRAKAKLVKGIKEALAQPMSAITIKSLLADTVFSEVATVPRT